MNRTKTTNRTILIATGALWASAALLAPTPLAAGSPDPVGPDVIVGELYDTMHFGVVGDIHAFAVGTDPCNVGDERVSWIAYTNQHPVWCQNLYKLADNRFQQIGMSWMSHGFYAVSQDTCGECTDVTNGDELGVGCSGCCGSAYSNGLQGNMSMRSDVNAHTGYFPYPWSAPEPEETIGKRIQVHDADIDPDLNENALYFIEGHFIAADDAAAGNGNNGATHRRVVVEDSETQEYTLDLEDTTERGRPAIRAWQDNDPTVVETDNQVPGEGLFIVAAKATETGAGMWHYEYAVFNLNSDRSAGSFTVPVPSGALVENIGFHDIEYHSGEIYDGTDWEAVRTDSAITWSTVPYGQNPNANALRFGTLYNFWFDTDAPPSPTAATIGLFKPGFPNVVGFTTTGPTSGLIDCNQNDNPDYCDVTCGQGCEPPCGDSEDCNENAVPDECEPDCDGDGIPDDCDVLDTDADGAPDCFDLCPYTTPPGACICPPLGVCCWGVYGPCELNYPHEDCINDGGTPDCMEPLCRDGCLIGDADADGDLDLWDFGAMQRCFSGSFDEAEFVMPSAECFRWFDVDEDQDVDLDEYFSFCINRGSPLD